MIRDAVSRERWRCAQASEQEYWARLDVGELLRVCAEKPDFLQLFPPARLAALFDGRDVLEIGCGPLGLCLASFYPEKGRLGRLLKIEPLPRLRLADTAAAHEAWARPFVAWVEKLTEEGDYVHGEGETVAEDSRFDTVVIFNVLDHVRSPIEVLRRAYRALRPGGMILLGVDCLSVLGRMRFEHLTRRRLKGIVLVDAHPYTFLPGHVRGLLARAGSVRPEIFGLPGLVRRFAGNSTRPGFLAVRPTAAR